jgi:hypothetical protein
MSSGTFLLFVVRFRSASEQTKTDEKIGLSVARHVLSPVGHFLPVWGKN